VQAVYRVLITDSLSKAGLRILEQTEGIEVVQRSGLTPQQVREELQSADAIIIRSGTTLTPEILDGQQRLKCIARAGVGVDNINLDAATRAGVLVMNTPSGNTISTAEHTFAMMLALSRNIGPAHASMKSGKWDRKSFQGTQLAGKTLAVIGLGRIGLSVAVRAVAFEMNVMGYDPLISEEKCREYGIQLFRDVDEIITHCDYLTVHTPLTDETRGIINAARMARMKRGVRLVNCARGGIIDETALADALDSGHVAGAALDVFIEEPPKDRRLADHPKVLATPHLGASTDEAQEMVSIEAAELVVAYLKRSEIRCAVNMAPVSAAEMNELRSYLDLCYRLGLLSAQMIRGQGLRSAEIIYRGEASARKTRILTNAFTAGLLEASLDESVNVINATSVAQARGIHIRETLTGDCENFASMVSVAVQTDHGRFEASGTIFGNQFMRLVRLNEFHFESYLDGLMFIYRHRDIPGLIGYMGTIFGEHKVNIAQMSLGRRVERPGGNSVAVLNLDSEPPADAIQKVRSHPDVTGVDIVRLPPAGAPLPWLTAAH
jgi:D-3-phosphoglycerate dehydrogenase